MKIAKLVLGGVALVTTYHVGKLVGGLEAMKIMVDGAEEVWPGCKKQVAKSIADEVVNRIFDKPEEEKGSQ